MSRTEPGSFINLDFETAPSFTAVQTADGWIDGTATGSASNDIYGWWGSPRATAVAMRFDNSLSRSGTNSLKLSTTDVTGRARAYTAVASGGTITATSVNLPYFVPCVAGGTYTLTGWAQTNNVAASGCFMELVEVNSAFAVGTSNASNALTGTNASWTQLTVTTTVASATRYLVIDCQNATAGNISDAWFDDIVLTGPVGHRTRLLGNGGLRPHPFSPGLAR